MSLDLHTWGFACLPLRKGGGALCVTEGLSNHRFESSPYMIIVVSFDARANPSTTYANPQKIFDFSGNPYHENPQSS